MAGGYSIQVCNLSIKETENDVRRFFSYCGTVLDVKMQKSGKKAQVANVSFKEPYALETALLLGGSIILIEQVYIVPVGAAEEALLEWQRQKMAIFNSQEEEDEKTHSGNRPLPFAGRAATMAQDVVTTMASKGYTLGKDAFTKSRELDEKYQVTVNAAAKVASLGRGAWSKAIELDEKYHVRANAGAKVASLGQTIGNADVRGMSKTVYGVSKSALATAGETMNNAGSAVVQSTYFSRGAMWASQTLDKAAKATGSLATKGNQGTK